MATEGRIRRHDRRAARSGRSHGRSSIGVTALGIIGLAIAVLIPKLHMFDILIELPIEHVFDPHQRKRTGLANEPFEVLDQIDANFDARAHDALIDDTSRGSTMSWIRETPLCQQFRDEIAKLEEKWAVIDRPVEELSEDAELLLQSITFEYSEWPNRQYQTDHSAVDSGESLLGERIRKIKEATGGLSISAESLKEASENFREALNRCLDLDVPQAAGRSVKLRNLMPTGDKPDLTIRVRVGSAIE
jgi:hypothetical protein